MAVAAPARRTAPAPAPSRTTPPPKRKAPARKPARSGAAAPAKTPARKPARSGAAAPAKAPARKPAPARRARASAAPATVPARRAPARRAPARAPQRAKPKRRTGNGQLIPLAVGRTAVAVRHLPDSGLVVRMTRGRAWIAVLGLLLVGIVALNVATLSFAAAAGEIDAEITALEKENSMLSSREAERYSTARIRHEAAAIGLAMPNTEEPRVIEFTPEDIATAAGRLAVAGG
jgi:hypothetical protein